MNSPAPALRTVAIVLAGGAGLRVGLDIPKQLLKVAGRTIIEHTVEALHSSPAIDEMLVVMTADHLPLLRELLNHDRYPKVTQLVVGGRDRNESTRRALRALGEIECNVLIHDAVRPLVSDRILQDCVEALQTFEAVDVAIPSADTLVQVDANENIVDIPDRRWLRRGQTPQGFRLSVIRRAYEIAQGVPNLGTTDNCGVVMQCLPDVTIHVVRGDEQNMKVTYPVDLFLIDKLFQLGSQPAVARSSAARVEALAGKTVVILGGSYGIGADIARLAEQVGCQVFAFGRSSTGTYVEDTAAVHMALETVHRLTGKIDAVFLTAAVLHRGPLLEMENHEIMRQVQVNYLAPVNVARVAQPFLQATGGHLVFFTSSSYTRGRAGYAMYSSTKAAVVNLTQALADEWLSAGIHVNIVNPERTRTPMRIEAFGAEPEGSLLGSEAVAIAALDLLTTDLTGHVIDIRLPRNSATGVDPRVP